MSIATPASKPLSASELRTLGAHGVKRRYPKSSILVSEGDATDALYVILEGRVKVFVSDEDGREVILGTQGPGEYFGELALDGGERSASVITLTPCRTLVVPLGEFRKFVAANPVFAWSLIEKLIGRLRALTASVKSLALMDVYGRVARLLLELAEDDDDGTQRIPGRLTQHEIARRVGASREMVGRILKDLSAGGYISVSRDAVVLHRKLPARW